MTPAPCNIGEPPCSVYESSVPGIDGANSASSGRDLVI